MINELLQPGIQQFIHQHELDDERNLVLKYRDIEGVPSARIAEQIAGRRKAKEKLSTYYTTPGIIYPPGVNLEQSSSEYTALYKVSIVKKENTPAGTMVDLTGGMGIDSYFLSKYFHRVEYVEPNDSLLDIARHNHAMPHAKNIYHHNAKAESYLQESPPVDLIYIDPSRRQKGQKVFKLSDCEPDVSALRDKILSRTNHLLIKTSPLLDIHQGLKELATVKKVFVLAVGNECKELLFLCTPEITSEPEIIAVNLRSSQTQEFSFTLLQEQQASPDYTSPEEYLYEPNASILKAGAFKIIAQRYHLSKLHPSTHLYTSKEMINDFPGKIFRIQAFVKSDKKEIQHYFPVGKANVVTRNYPLSPEELKKKTGLKDGGDKFLIGFTGKNGKFLTVADRIV